MQTGGKTAYIRRQIHPPVALRYGVFYQYKNCENIIYDAFTGQIDYRNALYFDG